MDFSFWQNRYPNRPIVEFEIAAREQMKVTELRLKKLFSSKTKVSSTSDQYPAVVVKKVEGTFCFVLLLKQLLWYQKRKFNWPTLLIFELSVAFSSSYTC